MMTSDMVYELVKIHVKESPVFKYLSYKEELFWVQVEQGKLFAVVSISPMDEVQIRIANDYCGQMRSQSILQTLDYSEAISFLESWYLYYKECVELIGEVA